MQPGLTIAPSLTLARPLGRGGMSTVWVAHHRELGRDVAVKFLSEELAQDPNAVARFEREASAVAELKNRYIVDVLEFGFTESGLPFMATELLDGEDLGEQLTRERRLDPNVFATIFEQICDALTAAHELGIVHRDIKPENVFVVKDPGAADGRPSIRLLDFGIAKHWRDPKLDVTSTGVVVGTPHYMSPEQFLSAKHVDFRADLWSLGVLAYRAVTGRLPFEASSFAALCIQIHRGVFPRASAYRADLPPTLDGWFTRALRGHPAARFGSARQMAESFKAALDAPVADGPSSDTGLAVPPRDLARRYVANARMPREVPSVDSDEVTLDLASLFPSDADRRAGAETVDDIPVRRRSRTLPTLVAVALSIAAVATIDPFEKIESATLASAPAHAPIHFEPNDPPEPAPVDSAPSPMPELRPMVIVAGKSNVTASPPRKTQAAAPSLPKEPDRGF